MPNGTLEYLDAQVPLLQTADIQTQANMCYKRGFDKFGQYYSEEAGADLKLCQCEKPNSGYSVSLDLSLADMMEGQ